MTQLELRKQLLIAESEINRVRLREEWHGMANGIHRLTDRAKSFGSIASAAAVLVAGLAALRGGQPAGGGAKASWLQTIIKGAGLVSNLWLAFRSRGREQNDK